MTDSLTPRADRAVLLELAERVVSEAPSRQLDEEIWNALNPMAMPSIYPHFTASLDAAVMLMCERGWGLTWDIESVHVPGDVGVCAYVWLDHMTNESSFIRSPAVKTFAEAVIWLPRLITANALRARAS